jgi:hypothetical protein
MQPAATVDDKTVEVTLALFDHIEDQINRTDTKAQVVLAVDALLPGWFSTQNPTAVQAPLGEHASTAARMAALLVGLVFVGLFLSLASVLVVIWPRAGASSPATLVCFGGIARPQRARLRRRLPGSVARRGDTGHPGQGAHHGAHRPAEVPLGQLQRCLPISHAGPVDRAGSAARGVALVRPSLHSRYCRANACAWGTRDRAETSMWPL